MKCNETRNLLPFYPDEVDTQTKILVEKHLAQCTKCRELYSALRKYYSHLNEIPQPDIPVDFEKEILARINTTKKISIIQRIPAWAGIAAIIIGAAFIITSLLLPRADTIEITYIPETQKKGKGPSKKADESNVRYSEHLIDLFSNMGYPVVSSSRDINTGLFDYFIFHVPRAEYNNFVQSFNALPVLNKIPEIKFAKVKGMLQVKVYFDMIRYAAGNFNDDRYGDYIIQHISGKEKGEWYLIPGREENDFGKAMTGGPGKGKHEYTGDFKMLPGDYNGDGYDDICLFYNQQGRSIDAIVLSNDHHIGFRKEKELSWNLTLPEELRLITLMAGDADGDHQDDYFILYEQTGDYFITSYKPGINEEWNVFPYLLKIYSPGVTIPFMGDMNGDEFSDLCLKIMQGDKAGETHIYFNDQQNGFNDPRPSLREDGRILLSYVGEYDFWTYDHNGDGLDDVGVKDGGDFISGNWFVCLSTGHGDFGKIIVIDPLGLK